MSDEFKVVKGDDGEYYIGVVVKGGGTGSGSGSGSSGAVTVADGADVAFGSKDDAAATSDSGSFTFISLFKRALASLTSVISAITTMSGKLPSSLGSQTSVSSLSVTLASDQTSVPVSLSDYATATHQSTLITAVTEIDGKLPGSVGQKTMALSLPVVVSSDQSTLPISAAALPLPTGAATAAGVTTVNTNITNMRAQLPTTIGQKAMTASMSVVVANDQSAVPVSAAALPLPSGASTSALQTTGNTTLAAIAGQLPSTLGAKAASASLSVAVATDQLLGGRVSSEPLGLLGAGSQIACTTVAAYVTLTTTTTRVSITASGAKVMFMVETSATATVTSTTGHVCLDGGSKDFRVPANSTISAIIADGESAASAVLYISELA